MAEKKYVSLSKLTKYDELLKAKMAADDAKVLADAKSYADGLSSNYEQAGSVATAKTELQGKIDAVQANVDTVSSANASTQADLDKLEKLVGTLPEGATATDVVGYVDEKTAGIATDAALAELQSQVNTNKTDIATVKNDYLKAADKTQLNDLITTEASTARAAEQANASAIKTISDDYLKASDKSALETSIAAAKKAGDDAQSDIDAFLAAAEVGDAAIDTLKELQDYISEHGEAAATMTANIKQNADDIDALETAVAAKAAQTDLANEVTARTNADAALDTRLKAVESAVGESGSVADDITAAKNEAISTAAADATTKADAAEANAKTYTDTEVAKDRTRLGALETATHTHANKAELDLIATGDKAKWDASAAKAHEHANAVVLDGISADKVAAWDKVSAKADQTALQSEIDRATAAEEANAAAIAEFIEVSEAEINQLFQTT